MPDIGVKLTGDRSDYNSMLDGATAKGIQFGTELTEKVGDKLFGLRDVSHAVATALGLNLENIAENMARFLTGVSKEEEEAYKKSAELSTQATDAAIKNMRAQANEETRYQLALQDRDRLIKQIDENAGVSGKNLAKVAQQKLDLETANAEIIKIENDRLEAQKKAFDELQKKAADRALAAQKLADDREAAELKLLTLDERRKVIAQEESDLKKLIQLGAVTEASAQEKTNFLAKQKNDLLAEEVAHKKAIALSAEDEILMFELQRKAATGLNEIDSKRLDLLKLQKQEKQTAVELATLEGKLVDGTLTPADKARLDQLIRQDDKLKDQIVKKQRLIDLATQHAAAEDKVLTEFQQQLVAIQKMSGAGTAGFSASPDGGKVGTTTVAELENALANAKNAFQQLTANPNSDPNYARDYISAQSLITQAESNLSIGKSQQFLNSNRPVPVSLLDFSSVASVADAALGPISPVATAANTTLKSILKSTAATATAVSAIGSGLAGKGLIIKNVFTTGPGGDPGAPSEVGLPDFSNGIGPII